MNCSEKMAEFIEKACAKNPDDRFRNCAEIITHFGGQKDAPRRMRRAKTVTLIYDPVEDEQVTELIDRLASDAAKLRALKLKISDLGEI